MHLFTGAIATPLIAMQQTDLTTLETAEKLGLLPEEYDAVKKELGRTPNFVELSIYSVMWSEHCSYKNSIKWLKTLPRDSDRMLAKAGEENAGLVDIGDGLACSFKIESHNHPSAIEPYQGAATGVGGINRDIFTMGARPIAQMNSLRFGKIDDERTKWLVRGVVKGIGDYGNAFGVPTVGGEVFFDKSYQINPLVNAFSAGIVKHGKNVSATSYGAGNPVFIVGSATGKDGIHGATFASGDISEDSVNELPSVQVGDPFQEKLLLEATLELIETDTIIGMQDMGAAGIICSTSEMSAKGEHGMNIWLDKVPLRQQNMEAWEILLSESQERMLIVVKKGKEAEVKAIFDKWDLNCEIIGEVTEGDTLQFYQHDELVAQVPADHLVLGGGAPVYDREYTEPAYYKEYQKFSLDQVADIAPAEYKEVAEHLLTHPNIASKDWVSQQYDSMVGTANASTNAPTDASVVHLKENDKALLLTLDCNSRYVQADPKIGTSIAVAEAVRNIVTTGGEALAVTNCLNFGNPYVPEVYWQFVKAIEGMREACEAFKTPVTGGNVSFYNQSSDEGPVFPTPTIGMLGLLEDLQKRVTIPFKAEGHKIYLLGKQPNCIASSQYLYSFCEIEKAPAPYYNEAEELALHKQFAALNAEGLIASAHDLADGGLFVALAESAMHSGIGFSITTSESLRKDAQLFGEAQGRILVSVKPEHTEKFTSSVNIPLRYLGETGGNAMVVDNQELFTVNEAQKMYEGVLPAKLGKV
jgi:phosphoribosylformylglycinamidine synthase